MTMARQPLPVQPGDLIADKYEIVRRIGKGGMGVVFEARHRIVGRQVAIKFLRADSNFDSKRLLRFEREARASGMLHHENIGGVLDIGEDEHRGPYIVMELVQGRSVRKLLHEQGALPVARACDLACQVARGLAAAHGAGILHRDLKPENLIVSQRGDGCDLLKLVDFGVARSTHDDATQLTQDGATPGTVHYLAPELARGDRDANEQTDIYALGVVLFELLTGERPHVGENHNAVLQHIANRPARSVEALRPDLPRSLVELVQRTLSERASERPQTATSLAQDLETVRTRGMAEVETETQTSESLLNPTPHASERDNRNAPLNRTTGRLDLRVGLAALLGLAAAVALLVLKQPVEQETVETVRPTRVTSASPNAATPARVVQAEVDVGEAPLRPPARERKAEERPQTPALSPTKRDLLDQTFPRFAGKPGNPSPASPRKDGLSERSKPLAEVPDPETNPLVPEFDRTNPFREKKADGWTLVDQQ